MKISKQYFRNKSVLALLGANGALFILAISNVLLNVDTKLNNISIVTYRSGRAIQVSGPTSDLYQFAIFAVIVTFGSVLLSIKLYNHRKHIAVAMLGLNIVLLVLCLVVFNALTRTI